MDAFRLAWLRIASGSWDRAIVGAGEENHDVINAAYENCGLRARDGLGGAQARPPTVSGPAKGPLRSSWNRPILPERAARERRTRIDGALAASGDRDAAAHGRALLERQPIATEECLDVDEWFLD